MPRRRIENRTIEVILLQWDKHLWERFEIVKVKPIFAQNVLFPQGLAVLADTNNRNKYEQKMATAVKEREKKAKSLEDLMSKIENDNGIAITRKANKEEVLYAKVDENDLVEIIKEKYSMDVDSHLFKLKKKITSLGQYNVPFMYKDLKRTITVTVNPEAEPKKEVKEEKVEETTEEKTEE